MLAIFLDIETTGLDSSKHGVIELAFKIIDISSRTERASYKTVVRQPYEIWEKSDPESIKINGQDWERVQAGKDPQMVKDDVVQIFNNQGIKRGQAVYVCQNPSFDRGFFNQIISVYQQEELDWPYHWLDLASMYWAILSNSNALPDQILLSKNAIAKAHNLPPEERPHSAMRGVEHLLLCYQAVLGFSMSGKSS